MNSNYPFRKIEEKWQSYWKKNQIFKVDNNSHKKKAYILEMLPYPSGKIHMGHVRNYTIGDATARFFRAKGFNVLYPMGWDAFGLPAENAALERGSHPKTWTLSNIAEMKRQLMSLGFSYDWDREISTCDKSYYGLEQKIFLDFYNKGLIYRKESFVNWDPVENTVLANEQVVNGRGWRSGAIVERKKLTQWSVRITAYAEELLSDLKKLSGWPEKVVKMQENWIGKSEGATINFAVEDSEKTVEIYTTRPETIFGALFIAISPNHPILENVYIDGLEDFIKECEKVGVTEEAISTIEKKGFDTKLFALHPFDKNLKLPIYVANFVVMDYGTGALFGCPAHDQRDFEFANLYNLPIKQVISSDNHQIPHTEKFGLMINSDFLNGLDVEQAKNKIIEEIENKKIGTRKINFRLRDWLVSRQRYWGCPIPIIHCDDCGVVKVPDENLPVELPDDVSFEKAGNPLENHPSWKHTKCPNCNKDALRETDTLDTFFESSWYFFRYCSPHSLQPLDKDICNHWMSVDLYIGGIEHAILHLLYARFFTKALRDCGYLNVDEPFKNLLTQGMVCHTTFKDAKGQWLYPSEVKKIGTEYFKISDNLPVVAGRNEKMSKSKKNLVDPESIVNSYGADAARFFILSDTPPDRDFEWSDEGLDGAWRYLNRLWRLFQKPLEKTQGNSKDNFLMETSHQLLAKITNAYENNGLNKVIAFCRELTNHIEDCFDNCSQKTLRECLKILIQALAPITPHICSEIANMMNFDIENWQDFNSKLIQKNEACVVVQINGKFRGMFNAKIDTSKEDL
jgi:leucyl-tRNA synthetase